METIFHHLPENVRNLNDIIGMCPGDSWDLVFDIPIVLEYGLWCNEESKKFECVSVHGWYWDEDDHCTDDFYFHDAGSLSWICKEYYLTKASHRLVMETIYNKLIKEGEIEVDENGNIIKNYFRKNIW